jgi:hypothetical protein
MSSPRAGVKFRRERVWDPLFQTADIESLYHKGEDGNSRQFAQGNPAALPFS